MSPDPHAPQDESGKADVSGYQADWLAKVGAAVAAGFEPQNEDPAARDDIDPADHDTLWAQVGQ